MEAGNDSAASLIFEEASMADRELFEGLSELPASRAKREGGKPRMREPERRQVELRPVDLDSLLSPEHPARVIWGYV